MPRFSIYELKGGFQGLLRPLTNALASHGVRPNHLTCAAILLCLLSSAALILWHGQRWPWLLVPAILFVRMALNAMDGMLAREHGMSSRLGAVLNELGDTISDTALYLPFALLPWSSNWLVSLVCIFSVIGEMTGLLSETSSAGRSFAGPMGKSDRAFAFGLLAFLIGAGVTPGRWLTASLAAIFGLLLLTIYNRAQAATRAPQTDA